MSLLISIIYFVEQGSSCSRKLQKPSHLVVLVFLVAFGVLFSLTASAQPSSADTAIETAQQWLVLADTNRVGQMWEQSDALMKAKSEENAWIKYVNEMRIRLGTSPNHRVWQSMEHQINYPGLPHGEFISVTFISDYPKAPVWERVSLIWLNDSWVPVGYQSGAMASAVK